MADDRFVFSEPEEERFIPWDEVIKGDKGEKGDPGHQGPKGDPGNYTKPDTGIPLTDLASDVQVSLAKADKAYIKPNTGIPKTDLASDVQTSLGKADTAYVKPNTGIPKTDLASDVQTSLGKANTAYVKPNTGIPKTDLASDVQTSLGKADTALQAGALPAGGTDGDVLVKNGATDYAARWTNTPKQMGSLATIEPTSSASKAYAVGDYLVYNGQLYKVTGAISPDETLNPGTGGNIEATSYGDVFSYKAVTEATGIQVFKNIGQYQVSAYKKNGIAVISLRTYTLDSTKTYISAADAVFNLPEGLRPLVGVYLPAACTTKTYAELGADFNTINAFVRVNDNGNVAVGASTNYTQVYVCGSYPVL